ncbi:AAA family ATPase [Halobacterium bonnevillei]|uniref:AAA domain-containing protein n=1 Tax=Halobacterium bonnevillei TaxID=2692200 RepID=A0A6B0SUI2_9EURY|nr:MoxR family ATPase [Halobacterium bonnevillei]MXR22460.1 AAA domain-containing protein [Halobacterium bonnevillei]
MDVDTAAQTCTDVIDAVGEAVVTDRAFLETILSGALARGHVLLEDVPGTGKTLTARSLADALGLEFTRVQFTPDLLPADITGSHVYDARTESFDFNPGPVFANVVLADEINRAPPKTQAALLEAMEEGQVSVDGETHQLPDPFFVIATQNPVEQEGTFRLPEAQRDRFAVKAGIGYPDRAGERELIDRRADRQTTTPEISQVVPDGALAALQQVPETVAVSDASAITSWDVGRATREDRRVDVGVSPRGTQRLFEVARARAVVNGRDYVAPDDVKQVALPVLVHRIVLTGEATVEGVDPEDVVRDVLDRVQVPAVS